MDMLEPSPFQPRQEMDESALQELADSIAQRGILQPLLVRPTPGRPGHYQIIAGERRWRAAQRVSIHEVPVLVRPLSDSDAMAAGLVENLQREDLNAIEEAEGYKRLLEEFSLSQDKLGEAVGKSRAHIGNVIRLLKLPEQVRAMLRQGQLSAGHARALLTHPDPVKAAKEVMARPFRPPDRSPRRPGHPPSQNRHRHRPARRCGCRSFGQQPLRAPRPQGSDQIQR